MAAKGARAISFPENMVTLDLPSFHTDHWDPLFSAAEEAGMPLCLHFGTSGKVPSTAPEAPMAVFISLMSCNSMYAVADLAFSPVFHRHPNLKIAFSEGGVGWIPYLLERMDATWEKHRFYQNVNQEVRPSELFRKHIWGCFIVDQHGLVEPGLDRHRPDAVGVRLPALRLPLAQQPQGGVGAVPRRPRRRGAPDRGAQRPGAVQLPPMSDDEEVRVDGESDWEDQDLLTLDLAAERLTEEIVVLEEQIAAAPGDVDLTDAKLRLERLVDARARFTKRSR